MAVFKKGSIAVAGTPLAEILAGATVEEQGLTPIQWADVHQKVQGAGAAIINLRGRSACQSPAHLSTSMLRGRIGADESPGPAAPTSIGASYATS